MVSAEEQEISVHQMIEKELCPTRQVESGFQWRRRQVCELCEWSLEERAFWQGKEGETARERTQEPLKETARRGARAPLKAEPIRRKGGEFRKSGWKRSGGRERKIKSTREEGESQKRKWWKKRTELIVNL